MASSRDTDPPDRSPREAVERYLNNKRLEAADSTLSTYRYRLKLFVEWCESENHESMHDIGAWQLDEYNHHRRAQDPATVSLAKELTTLRDFLAYCSKIGLAEPDLDEKLDIPTVEKRDAVNTGRLDAAVAEANTRAFRAAPELMGSKWHVVLELLWYTGARIGAIRGLDIGDVDLDPPDTDGAVIEFHHRPDTDTPLKNDEDGERAVNVPEDVAEVLRAYKLGHRPENPVDDYGRKPFIAASRGRPGQTTLRRWCYYATIPCHGGPCPHGQSPPTCDWNHHREANGCPSSYSPHRVRTGAITWMLNRGYPIERVSERVNTSVPVLRRHYDFPTKEESLERRRGYLDRLSFDDEQPDDHSDYQEEP